MYVSRTTAMEIESCSSSISNSCRDEPHTVCEIIQYIILQIHHQQKCPKVLHANSKLPEIHRSSDNKPTDNKILITDSN